MILAGGKKANQNFDVFCAEALSVSEAKFLLRQNIMPGGEGLSHYFKKGRI